MQPLNRRSFVARMGALFAAPWAVSHALTAPSADSPQRVTIAQIRVSRDISENLERYRAAFEKARKDTAGWALFPEMSLSGYHGEFDQAQVAAAFDRVRGWCAESKVIGLIGTGWKQDDKTYNQLRVVDRDGRFVSAYAKTCLCRGEDEWTSPGPLNMLHEVGGLKFGTLICNDLWVTPGFTEGPNPHLSLKIARAGARVLFHAINSGADQRYRAYHESNLLVRAAEAKFPIVACNAFSEPQVNATSGVIGPDHAYLAELPRDRESIQTVEFTPALR